MAGFIDDCLSGPAHRIVAGPGLYGDGGVNGLKNVVDLFLVLVRQVGVKQISRVFDLSFVILSDNAVFFLFHLFFGRVFGRVLDPIGPALFGALE